MKAAFAGQLDIFHAILAESSPTPAVRYKRSLGPRPAWSRFWEKVDRTDPSGCWMWTASVYRNGYGQFTVLGVPIKAHRWAYHHLVGRVPEGMRLDHTCHSRDTWCIGGDDCPHRRCVNPAHLEPVTDRENSRRGMGAPGRNFRKTHCDQGHAFDAANTRWRSTRYGRECRTCHREKTRAYRAARRQPVAS